MKQQYDFGMVGLGVMGRNLLLNMADKGFSTIGFDLDKTKGMRLEEDADPGVIVKAAGSLAEMVEALKTPRKILLLVPAGKAVDNIIQDLLELIDAGDIVIDGGNSFYKDTESRFEYLNARGIHFMGMGISGGEHGARVGASMMPGGNPEAFNAVKPMLEAVAAKADGQPCFAYMGNGASGHFVKMVHNGIEYAMMQMISEAYDLLKRGAGYTNKELHALFANWNNDKLKSYLIEITAAVFSVKDVETGNYVVDLVLDKAGSKGTGKWTTQEALNLMVPIPSIDAAVSARTLSGFKDERVKASALYPHPKEKPAIPKQQLADDLQQALAACFIAAYAQGIQLISVASEQYKMQISLSGVIQVWKAGCIIRSELLKTFEQSYRQNPGLENLLLDNSVSSMIREHDGSLRRVVNMAVSLKIPAAGIMSALAYLDAYTCERLPTNLVQAQRDFFGAHTYERVDKPGIFHTDWEM